VPFTRILYGVEKLCLSGEAEARKHAGGVEVALHAAQQGGVAGRRSQGFDVERLGRAIGERNCTRFGLEAAHEERGFFDFDLAAEVAQGHGENVLAIAALTRQETDTAVEDLAQAAIGDRLAFVGPGAVVM
jgi:hypothetical protein